MTAVLKENPSQQAATRNKCRINESSKKRTGLQSKSFQLRWFMVKKMPLAKRSEGTQTTRNLILVLGDQLNLDSPVLQNADWQQDAVLMIESAGEATWVWSHKARIALFLSAMRHFAAALRKSGARVHYQSMEDNPASALGDALKEAIKQFKPASVQCVEPG